MIMTALKICYEIKLKKKNTGFFLDYVLEILKILKFLFHIHIMNTLLLMIKTMKTTRFKGRIGIDPILVKF